MHASECLAYLISCEDLSAVAARTTFCSSVISCTIFHFPLSLLRVPAYSSKGCASDNPKSCHSHYGLSVGCPVFVQNISNAWNASSLLDLAPSYLIKHSSGTIPSLEPRDICITLSWHLSHCISMFLFYICSF